jgi:hypothetical protein
MYVCSLKHGPRAKAVGGLRTYHTSRFQPTETKLFFFSTILNSNSNVGFANGGFGK